MQMAYRYPILEKARQIANTNDLEHLASRKYLGEPLAEDMRRWLRQQPMHRLLCFDLAGIRTMNGSVAQEIGPLVMEAVAQSSVLEHRYPIFCLDNVDIMDSFALSFVKMNLNALGVVTVPVERSTVVIPIAQYQDANIVVLGPLTPQNEQILQLAEQKAELGQLLTSEMLEKLSFLAQVSAAARSKRLTELYNRRLLAFRDNPRNGKERMFLPPWRL
jgi:GGDEF domain-containing protein